MRSPKSRSRSKQNRNNNRSVGNVLNRVFDSSGPEGKVRGTPQQIIDKYNQLARDAQLSNDRVATENFQQHAEHYLRLLANAQKEQEAKREQHDKENRGRNADRERSRIENGLDISDENGSDFEKDVNPASTENDSKSDYAEVQEDSHPDKESSSFDRYEKSPKANRRKRNNNQSNNIETEDYKASSDPSKEAAE